MNWITTTRKSGKHLDATYGNTGQLFQPYLVLSAVYTVISPTGDRTTDYRMQNQNSTSPHRTQMMSNQIVLVIAQPINLIWTGGWVVAFWFYILGGRWFVLQWGDHDIHCWWDLIRLKQLSSVSICRTQVFTGFSGCGNSIHNIIPLLKKENVYRWNRKPLESFHIHWSEVKNTLQVFLCKTSAIYLMIVVLECSSFSLYIPFQTNIYTGMFWSV